MFQDAKECMHVDSRLSNNKIIQFAGAILSGVSHKETMSVNMMVVKSTKL